MVDKFRAMSAIGETGRYAEDAIMTDFCADQYWTIVADMEVADLDTFAMMSTPRGSAEDQKKIQEIMTGDHDLVDRRKREIYKIEG
ncbi:MAG: hypothetical protein ABJE47_22720 [bacterium]